MAPPTHKPLFCPSSISWAAPHCCHTCARDVVKAELRAASSLSAAALLAQLSVGAPLQIKRPRTTFQLVEGAAEQRGTCCWLIVTLPPPCFTGASHHTWIVTNDCLDRSGEFRRLTFRTNGFMFLCLFRHSFKKGTFWSSTSCFHPESVTPRLKLKRPKDDTDVHVLCSELHLLVDFSFYL